MTWRKILVANRGEIAVRVMRTAREMGFKTVAVYSDADRFALHTLTADEAWRLGPPAVRDSYLRGDLIIEAALRAGAQAVHPGYGFLAENPDFAEAVEAAGLTFIGPPADAIRALGSKIRARQMMTAAGVPVVPGDQRGLKDVEEALASAARLAYPVLIKAAAGGGGKGMRVVTTPDELPAAWEAAGREALSAFGVGTLYLEKFLTRPRHIEIQILADGHGNVVHLGERECSLQRRHQKVIEESPSPALVGDEELRRQIGEAAVAAAKACGYVNAGTVEFLFDAVSRRFYFLEVNTRLQVEHPVTEMVTGLDLVREQIRIAAGERLGVRQDRVHPRGHSIECRVYAEDPGAGFLPDAGTITARRLPSGPGVRVDVGVEEGEAVGVYYDPLIAKLVVWAPDRKQAIQRMRRALAEFQVAGVKTTIPFCLWVLNHPRFQAGDYDTDFISEEFKPEYLAQVKESDLTAAAVAAALWAESRAPTVAPVNGRASGDIISNWKRSGREQMLR